MSDNFRKESPIMKKGEWRKLEFVNSKIVNKDQMLPNSLILKFVAFNLNGLQTVWKKHFPLKGHSQEAAQYWKRFLIVSEIFFQMVHFLESKSVRDK